MMLITTAVSGADYESLIINENSVVVRAKAKEFRPGEVIVFELKMVENAKLEAVSMKFLQTDIPLFKEGNTWYGLMGVPAKIKPGKHKFTVYCVPPGGKAFTINSVIELKERDFRVSNLTVDPYYLEYTEEKLKRIRRESAILKKLWKVSTDEKMWEGTFPKPIDDVITQEFAVRRVFNGQHRSYHSGTDLKAAVGTPIHAANSGRVVMADDFYFSGKFIIIDHGRRVYSFYAHLSEFKVRPGDMVSKGDIIALSGDTGRISGPHLHWTIKINSVNVDPMSLTEMELY